MEFTLGTHDCFALGHHCRRTAMVVKYSLDSCLTVQGIATSGGISAKNTTHGRRHVLKRPNNFAICQRYRAEKEAPELGWLENGYGVMFHMEFLGEVSPGQTIHHRKPGVSGLHHRLPPLKISS